MKYLKTPIKLLIRLPYNLINWLVLSYRKVHYSNFPIINGLIRIRGKGKLMLGKNVKINSGMVHNPVGIANKCSFYIAPKATITIGDNVGISNSLLYARNSILIEQDVLIGGGCQLLDNDFHSLDYYERIENVKGLIKTKPITIRRGAFIGANSIILKGVSIGNKSIVGAGSVVTSSIPANQIWAGNPAKFIKDIKS